MSVLKVMILGAGPVGTILAAGLQAAGVQVSIWSRSCQSAQRAGELAKVVNFSGPQPPAEPITQSTVLVLAVRDAAIVEVAQMLAQAGLLAAHHCLLHCSGAMAAQEAFACVRGRVEGIGLLHPLRALPKGNASLSLEDAVFGVQGDRAGLAAAKQLCDHLGGRALELEQSQMAGYHAGAVMASNYVVAVLDAAVSTLEGQGLSRELALPALLELAKGALGQVEQQGLPGALSGPIRRGDRLTVERHLAALRSSSPQAADLYCSLGTWALGMANQSDDAEPKELRKISDLLSSYRSSE